MEWIAKLLERLKGLTKAMVRYPLTTLFLLAETIFIFISINGDKNLEKLILTCAVGAMLGITLEGVYERFFTKISTRLILIGCGIILSFGYYYILRPAPKLGMEIFIRTGAVVLALSFAFIWGPVIRSRISFNESFMAVFKAFFHTVLYSIVIFVGLSIIIMAIDTLIIQVNEKVYPHTANIVFVLFAPLFFLSLIPVYPGKRNKDINSEKVLEQEKFIQKATYCPKFLEVLISYIIIPLMSVFTIILFIYIIKNIGKEFWTNNLLEPMIVSYSVSVILIYILSSRMNNKFSYFYRLIFPKVLIPIELFQITSSVIRTVDMGVTHTRYFVILFGVFSVVAGFVMSFVNVQKNGIIALLLIVFSFISIIPPVDAFTVSRFSQENRLKSVLIQNKMLKDNAIIPKGSISKEDKKKIIAAAEYLTLMDYTDRIAWFPDNFIIYEDFYKTFGFQEYEITDNTNRSVNVFLNSSIPIDIKGFDVFVHTYINDDEDIEAPICIINKMGKSFTMKKEKIGGNYDIVLIDENNLEQIRFHTNEIFTKYKNYTMDKSFMSYEEATFTTENNQIKLSIIVQNASINSSFNETYYYVECYILVGFK